MRDAADSILILYIAIKVRFNHVYIYVYELRGRQGLVVVAKQKAALRYQSEGRALLILLLLASSCALFIGLARPM